MTVIVTQTNIKPQKLWATQIKAVSQIDGEIRTYCGPLIPGRTRMEAEQHCLECGLDYLEVLDIIVERQAVFQVGLN